MAPVLHKNAKLARNTKVEKLLADGANVNEKANFRPLEVNCLLRATPLIFAAYFKGNSKTIQLLVDHGADIHAVTADSGHFKENESDEPLFDRATALHVAAACSFSNVKRAKKVCRALIRNGADMSAKNKYGKTPEQVARQSRNSGTDAVASFLREQMQAQPAQAQSQSQGEELSPSTTAEAKSATVKDNDPVSVSVDLADEGEAPIPSNEPSSAVVERPSNQAPRDDAGEDNQNQNAPEVGDEVEVEVEVEVEDDDGEDDDDLLVDGEDEDDDESEDEDGDEEEADDADADADGDEEEVFVGRGDAVTTAERLFFNALKDDKKELALQALNRNQQYSLEKALVGSTYPEVYSEDLTLIHVAAADGNMDVLRGLLRKYNRTVSVDVSSKSGRSPLMFSCANRQHEATKLLLESGADVNAQDYFGNTPILHAIRHGDHEAADLLIPRGARTDIINNAEEDCVSIAMKNGNTRAAAQLSPHNIIVSGYPPPPKPGIMPAENSLCIVVLALHATMTYQLWPYPVGVASLALLVLPSLAMVTLPNQSVFERILTMLQLRYLYELALSFTNRPAKYTVRWAQVRLLQVVFGMVPHLVLHLVVFVAPTDHVRFLNIDLYFASLALTYVYSTMTLRQMYLEKFFLEVPGDISTRSGGGSSAIHVMMNVALRLPFWWAVSAFWVVEWYIGLLLLIIPIVIALNRAHLARVHEVELTLTDLVIAVTVYDGVYADSRYAFAAASFFSNMEVLVLLIIPCAISIPFVLPGILQYGVIGVAVAWLLHGMTVLWLKNCLPLEKETVQKYGRRRNGPGGSESDDNDPEEGNANDATRAVYPAESFAEFRERLKLKECAAFWRSIPYFASCISAQLATQFTELTSFRAKAKQKAEQRRRRRVSTQNAASRPETVISPEPQQGAPSPASSQMVARPVPSATATATATAAGALPASSAPSAMSSETMAVVPATPAETSDDAPPKATTADNVGPPLNVAPIVQKRIDKHKFSRERCKVNWCRDGKIFVTFFVTALFVLWASFFLECLFALCTVPFIVVLIFMPASLLCYLAWSLGTSPTAQALLSMKPAEQGALEYWKLARNEPRYKWESESYHYETRTRYYTDSNGNRRSETYQEKVVTHTAERTFIPDAYWDTSDPFPDCDELLFITFEHSNSFADDHSKSQYEEMRDEFKRFHDRDRYQNFSENYLCANDAFTAQLVYEEGGAPFFLRYPFYAFCSLLLAAFPYDIWVAGLTEFKHVETRKVLKVL